MMQLSLHLQLFNIFCIISFVLHTYIWVVNSSLFIEEVVIAFAFSFYTLIKFAFLYCTLVQRQ